MSHKLSMGAISEKIKFTLEIMVLCDVTPNTLNDRQVHFSAMRISHLISLKFMVFQAVMPRTKVISIFTTARTSSLLKLIFILVIPCNKTCFILLKTNNLHMQKIQIHEIWWCNNIIAYYNVEYIRWLHVIRIHSGFFLFTY